MCKLLVGLMFLVVLALELFFNRLRNGWLHTVRVVFWVEGWGKRYCAVTVELEIGWFCTVFFSSIDCFI